MIGTNGGLGMADILKKKNTIITEDIFGMKINNNTGRLNTY